MTTKSIDQSSPTGAVYGGLDAAYVFFNQRLFDGKLPHCLITLRTHGRSIAYFHGERFQPAHGSADGKMVSEIAMNPSHFESRTMKVILSTLVHEMCHTWQKYLGREPTRCYHDKQWGAKMKEVGLYPSHTGEPGGRETGQQMTHYIIDLGPFSRAADEYLVDHEPALYQDRLRALEVDRAAAVAARKRARKAKDGDDTEEPVEAPKSKGRAKFICPGCELIALAKPSALISCMTCSRAMVAEETS